MPAVCLPYKQKAVIRAAFPIGLPRLHERKVNRLRRRQRVEIADPDQLGPGRDAARNCAVWRHGKKPRYGQINSVKVMRTCSDKLAEIGVAAKMRRAGNSGFDSCQPIAERCSHRNSENTYLTCLDVASLGKPGKGGMLLAQHLSGKRFAEPEAGFRTRGLIRIRTHSKGRHVDHHGNITSLGKYRTQRPEQCFSAREHFVSADIIPSAMGVNAEYSRPTAFPNRPRENTPYRLAKAVDETEPLDDEAFRFFFIFADKRKAVLADLKRLAQPRNQSHPEHFHVS